eukprot:TRINITY_DN378_c2_g1_i2.p1 TRINITY_DN378_c2_g1~~TRINITY_DN378_c2_g1_i2.p1  ORF type:complete len:362 (-),score=90.66 TRINITY_DN378_c2_g1_i2:193-1278(-)
MLFLDLSLIIAEILTLLACFFSFMLIVQHLKNYNDPPIQRYVVRILWMVPIYAIDSLLSLNYKRYSLFFDMIKDCYEAYVLYCFFALLVGYLGGRSKLEELLDYKDAQAHAQFQSEQQELNTNQIKLISSQNYLQHHFFPLCCLSPFIPNKNFFRICKALILQFVLIKPITALLAIILDHFNLYDEGHYHTNRGYLYITIIENISVSLSLYFLILFYQVTQKDLAPFKPVPKFLCVKTIVFFCFWQGVLLDLLVKFNLLKPEGEFTVQIVASSVQDFLICVEMFILSILHNFVFAVIPSNEYSQFKNLQSLCDLEDFRALCNEEVKVNPILSNIKDIVNQSDVIQDTKEVFRPSIIREKLS